MALMAGTYGPEGGNDKICSGTIRTGGTIALRGPSGLRGDHRDGGGHNV